MPAPATRTAVPIRFSPAPPRSNPRVTKLRRVTCPPPRASTATPTDVVSLASAPDSLMRKLLAPPTHRNPTALAATATWPTDPKPAPPAPDPSNSIAAVPGVAEPATVSFWSWDPVTRVNTGAAGSAATIVVSVTAAPKIPTFVGTARGFASTNVPGPTTIATGAPSAAACAIASATVVKSASPSSPGARTWRTRPVAPAVRVRPVSSFRPVSSVVAANISSRPAVSIPRPGKKAGAGGPRLRKARGAPRRRPRRTRRTR